MAKKYTNCMFIVPTSFVIFFICYSLPYLGHVWHLWVRHCQVSEPLREMVSKASSKPLPGSIYTEVGLEQWVVLCCEICQLIIFQVLLLKKRLAISMNGTLSFDQVEKSWTHLRPSICITSISCFQSTKIKVYFTECLFVRSVRKSFSKRSSLRNMNWWTQGLQSNIATQFHFHFHFHFEKYELVDRGLTK